MVYVGKLIGVYWESKSKELGKYFPRLFSKNIAPSFHSIRSRACPVDNISKRLLLVAVRR